MDSNLRNKITWAATVAVFIFVFYAGMLQLLEAGFMAQWLLDLGYPRVFTGLVGFIQVVGAVLLLVPAAATFASGMLSVVMVGAIVTMLVDGHVGWAILPLVFLGLLLFVGWERSRVRGRWLEAHGHGQRMSHT